MSEAPATRWTPEQQAAIDARGANILVAAAAGSGKTATLVERVVRRLLDPVAPIDIDQLLVVTFTEAAATEMKERFGAALQGALEKDPENDRLRRQLALLPRASISTLHAFCLGLIRQYFYRLGLDPALQVMGEHEALLLRTEVLETLFGQRFEEDPDGPFYALVERYGGARGDEGLRRLVLDLHEYSQSLPWPEQWLAEAVARFDIPPEATIDSLIWWPSLRRQIRLQLTQATSALRQALRLTFLPGAPPYQEALAAELAAVEGAARIASAEGAAWDAVASATAMAEACFGRLPPVKAGTADPMLKEQASKLRDQAKKLLRSLKETYFCRPAAEWLDDLRAAAPHLRTLTDLVAQFSAAFRSAKLEQGSVDFGDLERYALHLLSEDPAGAPGQRPSDVARELRTRYAEILVDEYQDINGVQDAILRLVARDGSDGAPNRFMVGDVKQSIYRFRHANPLLFLQKYRSYTAWDGSPVKEGRIVLGANFRSRGGVVDGVNFLFRQMMTASAAELDYDRDAELVCRAGYPAVYDQETGEVAPDPPVEVHLLEKSSAAADSAAPDEDEERAEEAEAAAASAASAEVQDLAELTATEREARLVARRIRQLVDGTESAPPMQVWDKESGGYRRIRYRDILILLRVVTGRANTILEVLGQVGVPAYAQLSTGYFAATEVEVVLALLQLLDNPRQDIPLAAVLRSPVIGLAAAELARVRVAAPEGSFYESVVAAARDEADETGLGGVLSAFLARLQGWRTAARRRPLSQVVWQLYQETGYLNFVGGMPGGAQRKANLLALYDRARQFDQFARQGLFRFLRFIERLRAEQADMGSAPALGEGEDVVRVMSIHKSKGLEFPVVFVVDLGRSFGRQDQQGDLLLQRELGFGPHLVDPEHRVKYPTLAWHAVREAVRLEALAEEMRVLYVALTRARERLILVGSCREMAARCRRWAPAAGQSGWPLPETLLVSAESCLDWLGPALMRHESGTALRAHGEVLGISGDSEVARDPSRWSLKVWEFQELQNELGAVQAAEAAAKLDWERIGALEPLDRPFEPAAVAELKRRFDWRYPYAALVPRFAKMSVTELKGHFAPDADEAGAGAPADWLGEGERRPAAHLERYPVFMQEARSSLTPTELGTLMHLVLQHLDLTAPLDEPGVRAQVERMVEQELVRPEHAGAVDVPAIARFFASALGERILRRPGRVRRELSFTLAMPAAEVYPDLGPAVAAGESVIVQGMIDLLLEVEGGFVLVDYKTDKRNPAEAAERYRSQMSSYRKAVETILGRPVLETYLHFLVAGESVRV